MTDVERPSDLFALSPEAFERLAARLFESMGFEVERSGAPGDQGVDLRLRKDGQLSVVQCKRYRGTVGQPQIRDFFGAIQHEQAQRGYFITSGTFSLAAQTWAAGKPIVLVDGPDLVAAMRNADAGLEQPSPGQSAEVDADRGGATLLGLVRKALAAHVELGRLLIDGPPPRGRTFREVAEYLRRNLSLPEGAVGWLEGQEQRGRDASFYNPFASEDDDKRIMWKWRIVLVNEFDLASRNFMTKVLEAQEGQELVAPAWHVPSGNPLEPYVVIGTRWERRIPEMVVRNFSRILPPDDVEWEEIPTLAEWAARDAAAELEAQQQQANARREAESRMREVKAGRQDFLDAAKIRLELMPGLYCNSCSRWYPLPQAEASCRACARQLRRTDGDRFAQEVKWAKESAILPELKRLLKEWDAKSAKASGTQAELLRLSRELLADYAD